MRGRPITAEEFESMLAAIPQIRPNDSEVWRHYLTGLWLSELRLAESTIVSWGDDATFAVDFTGRRPRFRIYAESEKGRRDRLLPMTPDFAEFLLKDSPKKRQGLVFKLKSDLGEQLSVKRVGLIVSDIGEKAGVIVNSADRKFASAHDLRRSFGTRWANRVKPATLKLLMRHKSIETTMKYYVDQDADEIADQLWSQHAAVPPEVS